MDFRLEAWPLARTLSDEKHYLGLHSLDISRVSIATSGV